MAPFNHAENTVALGAHWRPYVCYKLCSKLQITHIMLKIDMRVHLAHWV